MASEEGSANAPPPTELEIKIGAVLKAWVKAAEKSRESFLKRGNEIMRYGFSPEYLFEYQTMNPKAWFKAKYGKTAEAFQVICPQLTQATPFRLFTPRPNTSDLQRIRAQISQDYSNYTTGITGHAKYSRRATVEAVGYGRGVRWTGRHPKSGLVYSTWSTVRELLVDPNAIIWEDVHGVARERVRPKCTVIRELKEIAERDPRQAPAMLRACAVVQSLPVAAKRKADTMSVFSWEEHESGSDCIRYYEVYLDEGVQNLKGGSAITKAMNGHEAGADIASEDGSYGGDETPLMFLLHESGRLIAVQEWSVPYHLMPFDGWPCTVKDYYDNPDSIWPVSLLDPGIGIQRAMNHIITLLMGKYRYTSKTVLAMRKTNRSGPSAKDKDRIIPRLTQEDVQAIEVEVSGGDNLGLKNFIEQFDYSQEFISYGIQLLDALEQRYERLTGLTEFLSTGQSPFQDRTAASAEIKDRASRTRIEDMRDREAEHEAMLARKEAFATRFLVDRGEMGRILGPEAEANWGFLAPAEAQSPDYWIDQALSQGLMDPNAQVMYAQQMLAQAVDISTYPMEIDYSIDAASVRRKDIDRQLDLFKEYFNQTGSQQMVSPDPLEKAIAYRATAAYWKLAGMPDAIVADNERMAQILETMPPPPVQPAGEEKPA